VNLLRATKINVNPLGAISFCKLPQCHQNFYLYPQCHSVHLSVKKDIKKARKEIEKIWQWQVGSGAKSSFQTPANRILTDRWTESTKGINKNFNETEGSSQKSVSLRVLMLILVALREFTQKTYFLYRINYSFHMFFYF
jgi:hypothetical protein